MFATYLALSRFAAVDNGVPTVVFEIGGHHICHITIAIAVLSESIMVKFAVFTSLRRFMEGFLHSVYHVSLLK